jgi:hypothetical protein
LALTYGKLAKQEIREDICRKAQKYIREALNILTESEYPQDYHRLIGNLKLIEESCSQIRNELI